MKLYETLGVAIGATKKEIKKAYKVLAAKFHPDREGGDEDEFKSIQRAYDVLGDDEITYDYEAEGNTGTGILDKILGSMAKDRSIKRVDAIRPPSSVPFDIGQQKLNWNNFAVLYRTNAQSRALEEVLLKYGVPYRLIGGIRFYERKEIKDES